jgi:hypothetical protein
MRVVLTNILAHAQPVPGGGRVRLDTPSMGAAQTRSQ